MGFPPTALRVLSGATAPSVLWSALDVVDPERSDLFFVPLDGDAATCEIVRPARVASFPWALRLVADQPFAAMRDADDVLVAVLGDTGERATLALLRLPSCAR